MSCPQPAVPYQLPTLNPATPQAIVHDTHQPEISTEVTAVQLTNMPVESRSRMISFRLTLEEYERFRELCFTNGIRSVSEMARAAINMLLQQPARAPQEALEGRVAELEGRLHMLALEMKKLTARTDQAPPSQAEPLRLAARPNR